MSTKPREGQRNQKDPTRGNELPRPAQFEKRVAGVLQHMIEPDDVVSRVAELDRRKLTFPHPGSTRASPVGNHHVGAVDLPAAVTDESQEGAGPTADIEEPTPPDIEQGLETRHLTRIVPLVPCIGGRLLRPMVRGTVDRGHHLFEHRSRAVELQPAGQAPSEMEPLKVGSER